jgi:glycosyltransferase involved in cell wall biosynthesis
MEKDKKTFSILITTKNRLTDLQFTLVKIQHLLNSNNVECIIFDDGSTDNTSDFIKENYPNIILLRNKFSKGLIYCRNQMLTQTKADYAISLDDDAHFESENILQNIENHFKTNPKCGVIACRIFWGLQLPDSIVSNEKMIRTKGFVGCGHVWNMQAWHDIPNYPDWFVFYGEEEFAAFQLFKKDWEVHYQPDLLVHHRVDVKSRKKDKDYTIRLRRSLRSGWYLYFLFYPLGQIPIRFCYSLWIQIKNKVLKGDFKATIAILQALGDIIINFPKLMKQSNRLGKSEFKVFNDLNETKIYWST